MKIRTLVLKFLILALLMPLTAMADGGDGSGGGNAVNGELFDFYENRGTIENSPALRRAIEEAEKVLGHTKLLVPEFPDRIMSYLKSKKLLVEPKPMSSASCLNRGSMILVDKQIVACQSANEVRFAKSFIEKDEPSALAQSAGLIIHEALLAYRYNNWSEADEAGKATIEVSIRELNRLIHRPGTADAMSFRQKIYDLGFRKRWSNLFRTAAEEVVAKQIESQNSPCKLIDFNGKLTSEQETLLLSHAAKLTSLYQGDNRNKVFQDILMSLAAGSRNIANGDVDFNQYCAGVH